MCDYFPKLPAANWYFYMLVSVSSLRRAVELSLGFAVNVLRVTPLTERTLQLGCNCYLNAKVSCLK